MATKPYLNSGLQCQHCSKIFSAERALKRHLRESNACNDTSVDVPAFPCQSCGSAFKRAEGLIRHHTRQQCRRIARKDGSLTARPKPKREMAIAGFDALPYSKRAKFTHSPLEHEPDLARQDVGDADSDVASVSSASEESDGIDHTAAGPIEVSTTRKTPDSRRTGRVYSYNVLPDPAIALFAIQAGPGSDTTYGTYPALQFVDQMQQKGIGEREELSLAKSGVPNLPPTHGEQSLGGSISQAEILHGNGSHKAQHHGPIIFPWTRNSSHTYLEHEVQILETVVHGIESQCIPKRSFGMSPVPDNGNAALYRELKAYSVKSGHSWSSLGSLFGREGHTKTRSSTKTVSSKYSVAESVRTYRSLDMPGPMLSPVDKELEQSRSVACESRRNLPPEDT